MKRIKQYFKRFTFLTFFQVFTALVISIGCFLGFPNDPQLSGIFWLATLACVLVNV